MSLRKPNSKELILLELRSGKQQKEIKTICLHHEQELLSKYIILQKSCYNPFGSHKPRTKSIRPFTLESYKKYPSCNIPPGKKLCVECVLRIQKGDTPPDKQPPNEQTEKSSDDEQTEKSSIDEQLDLMSMKEPQESSPEKESSFIEVNSALKNLDETPITKGQLHPHTRKNKGKQKLQSATKRLKRKLEVSYNVDLSSSDEECESSLFRKMMLELKEKYKMSKSYQERVQILTVSPFTIKRTEVEFGASNYLVKKSRAVKKEKGILGVCDKNKGKSISEETKRDVISFYEMDDNSRMCPGMKETITVRGSEGEKVKHQKRLVLMNLKEIYALWKESQSSNPDRKIGFSSFAALRPKWCVLAGASGTHSVCVCKYHQNPKLMVESCLKSNTHDLMKFCVCSNESEECMMGFCKKCPGREGLIKHLTELDELEELEEISYKQWISTDRTTLTTITKPKAEYIEELSSQITKLTRHSFTAKAQANYMKTLKESLKPLEEILVQGDFAENYNFVVQDEIQSFHWENKQATLHPFVAYRMTADGIIEHRNVCILSDSREHSTCTVFAFLKVLIEYLKKEFNGLKKIHYFTDGCAGQYKNCNNFLNLCYHKEDFGIDAEWNFFATSHGKSACDGIGGTVKRLVSSASLKRPYKDQILSTEEMYQFCIIDIPGIKFFNVPPSDIDDAKQMLETRFELAKTIKGTQQFHRYVPVSKTTLKVYKLSVQSDAPREVSVTGKTQTEEQSPLPIDTNFIIHKNYFVCCYYQKEPWIGIVEEVSDEFGDFFINFMHPKGPAKQFFWPSKKDCCWVMEEDIICVVASPVMTSSSSRKYNISKKDLIIISQICSKWPVVN